MYRLYTGDCLEVLRTLPDASVDSVVHDPPAGINFMGQTWDSDKKSPMRWIEWLAERLQECERVLKPGGHMFTWALPRISHRTATAIEMARFGIRDRVSHFFGTGFSKGGDLAKKIDKSLGVEPTIVGANPNHRAVSGVAYEGVYGGGNTGSAYLTAPTSEEAQEWNGWGSTLKPACEDWWLARKRFKGSLTNNVLKHGTGALNIDACRIPTEDKLTRKLGKSTESDSGWKSANRSEIAGKDGGRWPAHVILSHSEYCDDVSCVDDCPVPMLDAQSGIVSGGEGASKFFYVAKPSQKEKHAGLARLDGEKNIHPTVKSIGLMSWLVKLVTPPGGVVLDPFMGSGSTGVACIENGFQFIGIEQSPEYARIALKRIEHAKAMSK